MGKKVYRILVINPGSTSTKLAYYENEKEIFSETIRHSTEELNQFTRICDQFCFRHRNITSFLKEKNIDISKLDTIVARGGLTMPVPGGTYLVNESMLEHLRKCVMGAHASNLGAILAHELAKPYDIPCYIVDPVVVDEMEEIARLSGLKALPRKSIFHALNHKAVARKVAKEIGGKYEDFNFIVAHMGGGISIGIHKKGRVVDVNNALDGEGPFTPERSGTLPVGDLVRECFSGRYTLEYVLKKIKGKGGIVDYLGTNNMKRVSDEVKKGNKEWQLVYEAMAYQVAKCIGSMATVVNGEVDRIILTGGIAYDEMFVNWIIDRVKFIAPVVVYPGEEEMRALMEGALRVLKGEERPKIYGYFWR